MERVCDAFKNNLSNTIVDHFRPSPSTQCLCLEEPLAFAMEDGCAPPDDFAAVPLGPNEPGAFETWKVLVLVSFCAGWAGAAGAVGADAGGEGGGGGGAVVVAGASAFDGELGTVVRPLSDGDGRGGQAELSTPAP
jgi:hypothetical protein